MHTYVVCFLSYNLPLPAPLPRGGDIDVHSFGLQGQHSGLTPTGSSGLPFFINYRTPLTHRANMPQWTHDKTTSGTFPVGPKELKAASPMCLVALTPLSWKVHSVLSSWPSVMKITQYFSPRTVQSCLDEADYCSWSVFFLPSKFKMKCNGCCGRNGRLKIARAERWCDSATLLSTLMPSSQSRLVTKSQSHPLPNLGSLAFYLVLAPRSSLEAALLGWFHHLWTMRRNEPLLLCIPQTQVYSVIMAEDGSRQVWALLLVSCHFNVSFLAAHSSKRRTFLKHLLVSLWFQTHSGSLRQTHSPPLHSYLCTLLWH